MENLEITQQVIFALAAVVMMYKGFKFAISETPFSLKIIPFVINLFIIIISLIVIYNAEVIAELLLPYLGEIDTNYYLYGVGFLLLLLVIGQRREGKR